MNWDTQITQSKNIVNTLLEASEYLLVLMKEKKMTEGIAVYSSIVEGYEAVEAFQLNYELPPDFVNETVKIKKQLMQVVTGFESNNSNQIAGVLQFSLIPLMKKWKKLYNDFILEEVGTNQSNIGVYLCHASPRKAYPKERIQALVEEGKLQGQNLILFSSKDINFEEKTIKAEINRNGKWEEDVFEFPRVIHNIFPKGKSFQSKEERKLRKLIPFTSFSVGNKYSVPEKLVKTGRFAEYFIQFRVCTDLDIIYSHLDQHKSVVFKPILGRQGQHIYFVEKDNNKYIISQHKHKKSYNKDNFHIWLQDIILKENKSYIVQPFIKSQTKKKEPFDIRAHVQKNGEGKWVITKMYPRIGDNKSILSNISRGGYTEDMDMFLKREYKDKANLYKDNLVELTMGLTSHLDKVYGFALDELGLDIAIDETGRFWFHEVNNGPQSTYHEKERAENTIAYARYVKENGLFLKNEFEKRPALKGQFFAKNSNIDKVDFKFPTTIGLLIDDKKKGQKLAEACAYVAAYEESNFFMFSPNDIDFEEMLIKGSIFEKGVWVNKVVNYPDVIYDRLRAKGIKGYNYIYEELEGIKFTNELRGDSANKNEIYEKLIESDQFNDFIIPYKRVTRSIEVLKLIKKYNAIIMKPEVGSYTKGILFIELRGMNDYFIADGDDKRHITEIELIKIIKERIKSSNYLVQKYIETRTLDNQPFDVRVHLLKGRENEWVLSKMYPRIGTRHAVIMLAKNGGYIGEIKGFLKRNYGEEKSTKIHSEILDLTHNIAKDFEGNYENGLTDIAFDIAIDKEGNLFIIELNLNKPGVGFHELEVAQIVIPYCKTISNNKD
ncbi:YheC/YheD family protein [Alkalicoccobacillus porphyridii]|uniref:DUF8042 domain-containing protein n=1 Tax=Alkalicoccobacillus porphyridii TaxID=2597270 RepID=A0A554A479_9BACI|nr:YheC/YheD family protein [Alkalicoccobacillus porphyridii]TSB48500.1 hypothetical protein FN960_02810 [Alkalicoccobacillus porphyridii]